MCKILYVYIEIDVNDKGKILENIWLLSKVLIFHFSYVPIVFGASKKKCFFFGKAIDFQIFDHLNYILGTRFFLSP